MTGQREAGGGHEVLAGGTENPGAVFRRGEVVDRPAPRAGAALHAYLRQFGGRGFGGSAPVPVGLGEGREQLTFLPGEVALPPFPDWVLTEEALASVGRLLRRMHDASAGMPYDQDADWPRDLADPRGGTMLVHNDLCMENVVFRNGRAAGVIDFDLAAPGRPLWDVAMTARYWAPMLDPESAADLYRTPLDPAARLRVLADAYGLSAEDRAELPTAIEEATAVCRAFMAARITAGSTAYARALAARGGWPRWDRVQSWLTTNRAAFTHALLDGA